MWRPEGWNVVEIRRKTHKAGKFADSDLVEAGADAMLEVLRQVGNSKGGRVDDEYRHGTWVLLTDEMTGYENMA